MSDPNVTFKGPGQWPFLYTPRAKKIYFFHFKALLLKNYGNSFLTYVKDRFLLFSTIYSMFNKSCNAFSTHCMS